MDNYDYYGLYSNNNIKTTNVLEIQKKKINKENNRKKIYMNILGQCYKKIESYVDNGESYCIYKLPEFIYGYPIYNMTDCVMYIINNLNKNGFKCKYINPYIIFISWFVKKNNIYEIEDKKENNIINTLNLNYRPITDYNPTGNFISNNKYNY